MKSLQRLLVVSVGVAAFALLATAGRSDDGRRKRPWASEMLQKRQAFQKHADALPTQTPWYTTGDLPATSLKDSHFPEKNVRLDTKAKGKPQWTAMPDWQDGQLIRLPAGNRTATYLYRTIAGQDAVKVLAAFETADGLEVWLNGQKVHSANAKKPADHRVTLTLKQGENKLLVKVYHETGACDFAYALRPSPVASLDQLRSSYPVEVRLFQQYFPNYAGWFEATTATDLEQKTIHSLQGRLKDSQPQRGQLEDLVKQSKPGNDPAWLALFAATAVRVQALQTAAAAVKTVNFPALRLSIAELQSQFADSYRNGQQSLARVDELEQQAEAFQKAVAEKDDRAAGDYVQACAELQRRALVSENPLVDFDKLLVIRRDAEKLGLPQNWQGNSSMNPRLENEIAVLDLANANLKTIYKPAQPWFVGDLNLHFDAQKLLFSSIGENGRWQVFEMQRDGSGVTQVTPGEYPDIDNYNGIYLPDGRVMYVSNSTFVGVPCVGGADYVGTLHLLSADGKQVRRLCFEQDNDWYPAMMPDGSVLYLRWEYTDSAHYFSRVLMKMNPDGTNQAEYYGSNSYWPNSLFYAKPVPGSSTKFVGVISGHHGVPRMGELILFDVARGRKENHGAVQRIPGWGKPVPDVIQDGLVNGSWPKFLHPIPLSDKYFIVSCKPSSDANWGVYLADVFDNLVLLREEPGSAILEPIPLRKTPTPPIILDRVKPEQTTATVGIQDIYSGPGLAGVPRGAVKSLRLFQYEYSYRNMGGHYAVGIEGPWDVRRLLGTVPVQADGSALFEIPANTPVSLQPLDAEGKALQLKRSWFVGMPGEQVSCNGCHNPQNSGTELRRSLAMHQPPAKPTPWYGPKRGFSFLREVQPVLDKYCVGCHDGQQAAPNLADTEMTRTTMGGSFPKSYIELHPFVRRNGPEGDYSLLTPLEFHADTSDLVQLLTKGHYNVQLDHEAWDRLITWIDLNVPAHGTWHEVGRIPQNFEQRRYEMKKLYAGVDEDIEEIVNPYERTEKFIQPAPLPAKPAPVKVPGWPLTPQAARQLQSLSGPLDSRMDLGHGLAIELRRVPAGEFAMGDLSGYADESPLARVRIAKPFWMAVAEVSLEQYQQFAPDHRNGYYDMHYKDQVKPGYLMDFPTLPVIRVSWQAAMKFCQWLSQKTGRKVTLPTEAQWEWACRAGTDTPCSYGDLDTDFAKSANLGDRSLKLLAVSGVNPQPIPNPDKFWDFVPKDDRFDDGVLHLAEIGHYAGNAWGLKDMHGNVAEWTRSTYRPYPYDPALEDSDDLTLAKRTVRGGSWYDRPKHARSAFRQAYPSWQRVYNVGFRIIVED